MKQGTREQRTEQENGKHTGLRKTIEKCTEGAERDREKRVMRVRTESKNVSSTISIFYFETCPSFSCIDL